LLETAGGREIHPFLNIKEDFKLGKEGIQEIISKLNICLNISKKNN
jgi:hypothetical protein